MIFINEMTIQESVFVREWSTAIKGWGSTPYSIGKLIHSFW